MGIDSDQCLFRAFAVGAHLCAERLGAAESFVIEHRFDHCDIDLLATIGGENRAIWFESDGAQPPNFTEREIGAAGDGPVTILPADLDGDGDADLIIASKLDGVVRWFDMLVWAARYWVAFRLIGSPIDVLPAVLLATVSQVVLLVPFAGNGLGFREWAVGLVAGRFAIAAVSLGIIADLVNRIAELAVAIPAGLIAWSILSRRLARRSAHGPADADPSAPTQTE